MNSPENCASLIPCERCGFEQYCTINYFCGHETYESHESIIIKLIC